MASLNRSLASPGKFLPYRAQVSCMKNKARVYGLFSDKTENQKKKYIGDESHLLLSGWDTNTSHVITPQIKLVLILFTS